jgi:hypothetical protein
MLGNVLRFFKKDLEAYLAQIGVGSAIKVGFPSYEENRESINFTGDGINLMIVNIEEENTLRRSDAFQHESKGRSIPALPEIRLNLYLLFVADLAQYEFSMDLLSLVVRYFQARRVFTPANSPGLAAYPDIEKLTAELITLPFAQQNEVWNALRTSYKPSLLYKMRMIVYTHEDNLVDFPTVQRIERKLNE